MKRKLLGRVSAVAMASAMMVSMFGMTTFAADKVTSVDLTKTITADSNVLAPDADFTFTVEPATVSDGTENTEGEVVYSGVGGGASFGIGDNTIDFAPGDNLSKSTQISLNSSVFKAPGIYRYEVKESAGSYDGMSYSDSVYYLDLYVVNGTNGFEIDAAIVRNSEGNKVDDIEFINTYTTNNLTVQKTVTGNQGNLTKEFGFSITVTAAGGAEEQYTMIVTNQNQSTESYTLTSGEEKTFTLANGETAVIYGLSANDSYVVNETDRNADGYTTTVSGSENGKISQDTTVTYTNNRNVTAPTGIIMNIAPYIVLVAFAAVAALFFLRRRNNREF